MGQEKQRISERLARVDTEREKLSNSKSWNLPNVFWHDSGRKRSKPRSGGVRALRALVGRYRPLPIKSPLVSAPARGSAGLGIYAAFIGIIGTVKPAARVRSSVGIPYQRTTASSEQHD